MSCEPSKADLNTSGSPAYGTFSRPSFISDPATSHGDSNDSTTLESTVEDDDLSPTSRPVPERKPSRHIEFRKYLKRPYKDTQRTLSDALRSARSREEQETLLPEEDYAGSDGCFNGQGQPMAPRIPGTHPVNNYLTYRTYFNIHR